METPTQMSQKIVITNSTIWLVLLFSGNTLNVAGMARPFYVNRQLCQTSAWLRIKQLMWS